MSKKGTVMSLIPKRKHQQKENDRVCVHRPHQVAEEAERFFILPDDFPKGLVMLYQQKAKNRDKIKYLGSNIIKVEQQGIRSNQVPN